MPAGRGRKRLADCVPGHRWSIAAEGHRRRICRSGDRRQYIACVRVGILGAAEARLNGAVVDLGTRKQRAPLAALAMHRGRPVVPDSIVDLLWGESPPTAVTATLQGYDARLRRALRRATGVS
jgi:two-component SAPR family response regulator